MTSLLNFPANPTAGVTTHSAGGVEFVCTDSGTMNGNDAVWEIQAGNAAGTGGIAEYSDQSLYSNDDIVWEGTQIYRNTTAVTVAETFDVSKWTELSPAPEGFNAMDARDALAISDAGNVLTYTDNTDAVNTFTPTGTYTDSAAQAAVAISDTGNTLSYTDGTGAGQSFTPSFTVYTDAEARDALAISDTNGVLTYTDNADTVQTYQPFPAGTSMVFYQASAPTGWTKSTANTDRALRVVSGDGGGKGGTDDLSTPPSTSHTHTFSGDSVTSSSSGSHSHTFSGSSSTTSSNGDHTHGNSLSAGAHTLTTNEMPSHTHGTAGGQPNQRGPTNTPWAITTSGSNSSPTTNVTQPTGGGASHSHPLSGSINSAGAHTHTATAAGSVPSSGTGHTHTTTATGTNTDAGPTAFAPKYIDVIVATKDA